MITTCDVQDRTNPWDFYKWIIPNKSSECQNLSWISTFTWGYMQIAWETAKYFYHTPLTMEYEDDF